MNCCSGEGCLFVGSISAISSHTTATTCNSLLVPRHRRVPRRGWVSSRARRRTQLSCAAENKDTRGGEEYQRDTGGPFKLPKIALPGAHEDDAQILALAVPAALALAADPLLQVVDTAFVGHAGPDALAALGINSALFTFSFLVFNFLGTATTPLVARAKSSQNATKAGLVTLQALTVAAVCGSLLTVALLVGSDQALHVMGADPEANPGVFGGLQDMKTPLGITASANMINLSLDVFLILGLGWGVRGAACATTVAEWTAASCYLYFLWTRRESLGGSSAPEAMKKMDAQELIASFRPFFNAGGAVLMRTILLLGTKTVASATAARLGSTAIGSIRS
eukprot:jgi/Picre1/30773/NNA_006133.t1